jgi:hypothetical protein
MIPEEDRGPAWLRDYGFTDFGDIAADINAMQEYAKKLAADVEDNYAPHLNGMSAAMLTRLPVPDPAFYELTSFIKSHTSVQVVTQNNVYAFGEGTSILASAAQKISTEYKGTDAFAHAKVADVHDVLGSASPTPTTSDGTSDADR